MKFAARKKLEGVEKIMKKMYEERGKGCRKDTTGVHLSSLSGSRSKRKDE
jgi:hypothetical protein